MEIPSPISKSVILFYTLLSFYIFGFTLSSYFITFPRFFYVHENWQAFMTLYNSKTTIFLSIPSVLWLTSAILLWFYSPKSFPKWIIYTAIGLTLISVSATLLSVLPIFKTMQNVGFNSETHAHLLSNSVYLQIIPSGFVCLSSLYLLNIYFQTIKPFRRWLFILLTILTFYLIGTNTVEALIEYRLWNIVSATDWLPYRHNGPSMGVFLAVYLVPGWSTLLLIIPIIWLRPKGISIILPVVYLLLSIWSAFITVTYFVPKAQMPLDDAYSKQILVDLVTNDDLKRVWVMYAFASIIALMFWKTEVFQTSK
jgi:hypothetical protein